MEKKYTLAEIRLYLQRSNSLGDAIYYLNQFDKIVNAEEIEDPMDEIFCENYFDSETGIG
jgi:hypothetical protein